MGLFDKGRDDLKQGAGAVVNGGAHLIGGGLDAVGLHGAASAVGAEGDKIGYSLGADVGELQLGQAGDPREYRHSSARTVGRMNGFNTLGISFSHDQ